jgi:hypothetical protein
MTAPSGASDPCTTASAPDAESGDSSGRIVVCQSALAATSFKFSAMVSPVMHMAEGSNSGSRVLRSTGTPPGVIKILHVAFAGRFTVNQNRDPLRNFIDLPLIQLATTILGPKTSAVRAGTQLLAALAAGKH